MLRSALQPTVKQKRNLGSRLWNFWFWLGLTIILISGLATLFAPFLVRFPPNELHIQNSLSAPNHLYWLGTDELGRDLFSRLLYGGRISFMVALLTVAIGVPIGCFLGVVAALRGGVVDTFVMRLVDLQLSMPGTLFALVLITVLAPSTRSIIIALSIGLIPLFSRISRAAMFREMNKDYVLAAKALGASDWRIGFRHLLPNIGQDILTQASLVLPGMMAAEAGLTFIGLGVSPEQPSWGRMIAQALPYIYNAPYFIAVPVVALAIVTLGFFFISDTLQARIDPRAREAMRRRKLR